MRNYGANCSVCGNPTRIDNRYGICNMTLECRRKKSLVKYERYKDSWKSVSDSYSFANREKINSKDRANYAAQRHAPVTYVAWSAGLGLCKIGTTIGIKVRFKALRNACPDIRLVAVFPCGRELERYLHAMLSSSLVRGEWFNLGPDLVLALLKVVPEVIDFAAKEIANG